MAQKKMLLVEMDEKGIHTQVVGDVPGIMMMVTEALNMSREAIEKHPNASREDSVKLMDEVIKQYQTEARYGKEAAFARAMVVFLEHC